MFIRIHVAVCQHVVCPSTLRLLAREPWPVIRSDDVLDQFAFRPTGSTPAALIYILRHVTLLLETNDYVRSLLVDVSKAFDTVNHFILIKKLQKLYIPLIVINWISNN